MTLSPPGSDLERDSYPFRFCFPETHQGRSAVPTTHLGESGQLNPGLLPRSGWMTGPGAWAVIWKMLLVDLGE